MRRNPLGFSKGTIIIVSLVATVIAVFTFLMVRFYEGPLTEGVISKMVYEPARIYYVEIIHSIYRQEPHTSLSIDEDGNVHISTHTVSVFDHYEYTVDEVLDRADFIITIEKTSKKREGMVRSSTFHTTDEKYQIYKIGDTGLFNRSGGDRWAESNNSSKEIERSRFHFDMNIDKYKERILTTE